MRGLARVENGDDNGNRCGGGSSDGGGDADGDGVPLLPLPTLSSPGHTSSSVLERLLDMGYCCYLFVWFVKGHSKEEEMTGRKVEKWTSRYSPPRKMTPTPT